MATLQERVAESYPSLMPLLNHPEVGRLLRQAVGTPPMSANVFRSKLEATRWFRSQSAQQRQWWVTARLDPGEARMKRSQYSAELMKVAEGLGIRLNSAHVKQITETGLSRGLLPSDARMQADLLRYGLSRPGLMEAGAYKSAQTQVRAIGAGQWLREPPRAESEKWAADIALGRKTIEDFNAANAYAASKRFPHLAEQIKSGMTVAEAVAPVVEAYAREMDWDPNGLMAKIHKDPKHTGLLGIRDPKTKEMRLPTEHEAMVLARKRADWWETTRGQQADTAMSQRLLETFGIRK